MIHLYIWYGQIWLEIDSNNRINEIKRLKCIPHIFTATMI